MTGLWFYFFRCGESHLERGESRLGRSHVYGWMFLILFMSMPVWISRPNLSLISWELFYMDDAVTGADDPG